MGFNETTSALELTFNEQSVVIALSFVFSILCCVLLAGVLFGALAHVSCGGGQCVECGDWDEMPCVICCTYVGYKYCPRWCCTDWRRHMKESVSQMQQELYEQEMEEMRELESREEAKRQEDRRKWAETEQNLKLK